MNITLSSAGNVAVTRGEKITRGQSRSKLIKVNWRSNESPPELPISNTKHIGIENLVVQVNITRPDGEYSGWQDMIKIDGEIAFYYPLQKWDTEVSGKAQCQIRWFKAGDDGDDDTTTVYTSNQASFIIDNGAIAQTLTPDLTDYTTWQAIITALQSRAFRKFDIMNLSDDAMYNANGKKSAPAIYFNVSNGDYSGLLIVSKHESGNNTIQTETLFAIGGIFTRTITFSTTDYNDSINSNPTGTVTEYRDITKNNFTETQFATLNSGITEEKITEIEDNLGNRVEKSSNTGAYLVYARKAGVEGTYEVTMEPGTGTEHRWTIPLRNANGGLEVPTPTNQYESANKKFVEDTVAQAVVSVYKYKGSVLTFSNLPSNLTNAECGWVYDVQETGDNYAWTGTGWDKIAGNLNIKNGDGNYSLVQKEGDTSTGESDDRKNYTYGRSNVAFGHKNKTYQRDSFAFGGGNTVGITEEQFNDYFWDSENNVAKNGGQGKNAQNQILDDHGKTYTGSYSFGLALGADNTVSGYTAVAVNEANIASGNRSFAAGVETKATGNRSVTFGYKSISGGENAIAIGENTNASGHSSFAGGIASVAPGNYSFAFGGKGNASTENGNPTTASGKYSVALGAGSKASGKWSMAIGLDTESTGLVSFAGGWNTKSTGLNSFVYGQESEATGDRGIALGWGIKAGRDQLICGCFNDPSIVTYSAVRFAVGTGGGNNSRRTSFVVLDNGAVRSYNTPTDDNDVVTKKYFIDNLPSGGLNLYIHHIHSYNADTFDDLNLYLYTTRSTPYTLGEDIDLVDQMSKGYIFNPGEMKSYVVLYCSFSTANNRNHMTAYCMSPVGSASSRDFDLSNSSSSFSDTVTQL